jgi:hypothetical protein
LAFFAIVVSSCKKDSEPEEKTTYYSADSSLGNGKVRTFGTISNSGAPQEVGIILTASALSGLPTENALYELTFPQQVIDVTLFTHMLLGLSAHGHPLYPSGSIGPHFDVRYFIVPQAERNAIPAPPTTGYPAGAGFDETPAAGYLPDNFVMNFAVGKMGRHWNESTTATEVPHAMIYGTWNGAFTFLTINMTLEALQTGQRISMVYPQPTKFSRHGYYPTKYNAYKDDKGQYRISVSDFVEH